MRERTIARSGLTWLVSTVFAAAIVILAVACGSDPVGPLSNGAEPDDTVELLYVGGSATAGVDGFAVMPSFVRSASGDVNMSGERLEPNSTIYFVDAAGASIRSELPGFDGDAPHVATAVVSWTRIEDTSYVLVSRCDEPSVDLENAPCVPDAGSDVGLYAIPAGRPATLVASSEAFARGREVLAAVVGSGSVPVVFNLLVRDPGTGHVEVVSLRAEDGRMVAAREVDPTFGSDPAVCLTRDGTVFGAGGLDGITVRFQDGGEVRAGGLSTENGWFQELRCGDTDAFVITSFGAVFVLDGTGLPTDPVLPPAPIDDRRSSSVSLVPGVDENTTMLVVGSGPADITSMTLPGTSDDADEHEAASWAASLTGQTWTTTPVGLLQPRRANMALTADSRDLLEVGIPDPTGRFFTIP